LARALTAAFAAHAQIVNLSLAGPNDPLLGDLIREGQHRGVLFVGAAAADAGAQPGLMHQAGVIEVASADNQPATDTVIYAPGREILTLLPGGHYDFASGASIATAQVSGVIALMLAKNPTLTAASAFRLLRDTSSPLKAADGAGAVNGVDACAAVVTLVGQGSCHSREADRSLADPNGNRMALH
jgi:subtilisin family serine protease